MVVYVILVLHDARIHVTWTFLLPSHNCVGHDTALVLVWDMCPTLHLKFGHLKINETKRKKEEGEKDLKFISWLQPLYM